MESPRDRIYSDVDNYYLFNCYLLQCILTTRAHTFQTCSGNTISGKWPVLYTGHYIIWRMHGQALLVVRSNFRRRQGYSDVRSTHHWARPSEHIPSDQRRVDNIQSCLCIYLRMYPCTHLRRYQY